MIDLDLINKFIVVLKFLDFLIHFILFVKADIRHIY